MKNISKIRELIILVVASVVMIGYILDTDARDYDPVCEKNFLDPVFEASHWEEDIETAKQLIVNADDDEIDCVTEIDSKTLLHWAATFGWSTEIAELLFMKGADIHALDFQGKTPLHVASRWGQTNIVELLLSKGANGNATDDGGRTALFWASYAGHSDIADLLIANGVDIDAQDNLGISALTQASNEGHIEIVKLLVSKGSNVNLTTNNDNTALDWALKKGHSEIVELLKANGAK